MVNELTSDEKEFWAKEVEAIAELLYGKCKTEDIILLKNGGD